MTYHSLWTSFSFPKQKRCYHGPQWPATIVFSLKLRMQYAPPLLLNVPVPTTTGTGPTPTMWNRIRIDSAALRSAPER